MTVAAFVISCVAVAISIAAFVVKTYMDVAEKKYRNWVDSICKTLARGLRGEGQNDMLIDDEQIPYALRAKSEGYLVLQTSTNDGRLHASVNPKK